MSERIMTLHPEKGKTGVNIEAAKYHQIKDAILSELEGEQVRFSDLVQRLEEKLSGKFEGSIPWYVVSVKLDLEARGVIARVPKSSPQLLQMVGKAPGG